MDTSVNWKTKIAFSTTISRKNDLNIFATVKYCMYKENKTYEV